MIFRYLTATVLAVALLLAQDTIGAGTYKGTWTGSTGGGDFHITVRADGKGEVGFTINGTEIPGKFTSLKVDGAKITMSYDFDLEGNKLTSAAEGTLKGKTIEGTYKTTAGDQAVDNGTWKVTAQ